MVTSELFLTLGAGKIVASARPPVIYKVDPEAASCFRCPPPIRGELKEVRTSLVVKRKV